jgi:hypothetical protein
MLLHKNLWRVKTKFPEGQYSVSRIETTSNTVGIDMVVRAKTLGLFRFRVLQLRSGLLSGGLSPGRVRSCHACLRR